MNMRTVLAIESSCDETAIAILRGDFTADGVGECEVLASKIASQIELHKEYGGVVPELASRNHGLQIEPLMRQVLEEAGISIQGIDAFAATAGPGLASSLLIGHTAAKGMALAAGKPFISVNHMEGHLLSPFIHQESGLQPNISLVVSGGHTMLIHVEKFGQYTLLGKTKDDAAGEAYDKVAKMLGLPYPGGPEIERYARDGDVKKYKFPRSMKNQGLDFSFSGLKTAVLYTLKDLDAENAVAPKDNIPDLCASFQQAVIDVLILKTIRAAEIQGVDTVTVSGGVSCNQALRDQLKHACDRADKNLLVCEKSLSTDNAVMIAYTALLHHIEGESSPLTCDVDPNMPLNMMHLRK